MFRPRILWKFYASYLILLVITAVIVEAIIARQIARDAQQSIRATLHAQALFLQPTVATVLETPDLGALQFTLHQLGASTGTHLTVIRHDGTVTADSLSNPAQHTNQGKQPEILAAAIAPPGVHTRISHRLEQPTMFLALPLYRDKTLLGYVRTAMPLTSMTTRLTRFRIVLVVAASSAALIGLILSLFFTRDITQPLLDMTEVATSLAGKPEATARDASSRDELDTFAQAFNHMAQHLRERIETVIKDHNQLLAVLTSMVEGVIAVDHHECVVHMNQAAGTILNASPVTSIGKPLWEITRVRAVLETLGGTIRDAEGMSCEARIVTPPGDRRLKLNAAPLRDSQSVLVGAVMVLHDVTEIRRLENVRRDFVANVSHELKTPITTIKGFVETLQDGALNEPEQASRFLSIIARNADRLHAIIEDLLSLSRLDQSEETNELLRSEVILEAALQAAIQDCSAKAAARQITLIPACNPSLTAMLNAPLIGQAIVNLLDNAINYSKPDSTVWLQAAYDDATLEITVRDEGIGIPQEHLSRLFERFYRVDKARSRDQGGTGLGLAIVKHVAQVHGGQVTVTSTVSGGSTFTLCFPTSADKLNTVNRIPPSNHV